MLHRPCLAETICLTGLRQRFNPLHDALSVVARRCRVIDGIERDRDCAVLNNVGLTGKRAVAVNAGVHTGRQGLNVGPGESALVGVEHSLVDVGVAGHAGLDNLGLGEVGGQLRDVDVDAVPERQNGTSLRHAIDELVDNLDRDVGGPSGRVRLVGDVKVGHRFVAGGKGNGGNAALSRGISAIVQLNWPRKVPAEITYAAPAVPDRVQTNGPRLVP